jgi:hypothetical protein
LRIEAEEAAEAELKRLEEEEKQRKKQKQAEKIARQKQEGTYMTKAQKAKAKLVEQRLEAMRAAGMIPTAASEGTKPEAIVYDSKKKGKGKKNNVQPPHQPAVPVAPKVEPPVEQVMQESKTPVVAEAVEAEEAVEVEESKDEVKDESSGDEWDVDSDDDNDDKFNELAARLEKVHVDDEDVDLIELEKKKEQERLRLLGLKRAGRGRSYPKGSHGEATSGIGKTKALGTRKGKFGGPLSR